MIYFYFKTLFSFRFYHRLAFASFKQMLPYALFLYVLSVVVSFFAAGAYVNKNMPLFLKNFPQVTFEKGVLTEPAHPVSAKIPQTDFKITFDAVAPMPPSDKELIRSGTLFWVNKNTIYSPASGRLDTKLIPADFSFVSSQENLEKEKAFLIFSTRLMLFFFSLLTIPFVLFFGFCLAATVGMVCKMWYRNPVPNNIIFKWAFFLLGPLSILWYVHLWVRIPLFTLAQTILCIIYLQQIFNLMEAHR